MIPLSGNITLAELCTRFCLLDRVSILEIGFDADGVNVFLFLARAEAERRIRAATEGPDLIERGSIQIDSVAELEVLRARVIAAARQAVNGRGVIEAAEWEGLYAAVHALDAATPGGPA